MSVIHLWPTTKFYYRQAVDWFVDVGALFVDRNVCSLQLLLGLTGAVLPVQYTQGYVIIFYCLKFVITPTSRFKLRNFSPREQDSLVMPPAIRF
jgi:hypothetical protein